MATADLHDLSIDTPRGPGLLASIFASLAVHPSAPLLDASSEAALSHPVTPHQLRFSIAWWRSQRQAKQARQAVRRLAETSPHLLRDVGLPETGMSDIGSERHRYDLRGGPC